MTPTAATRYDIGIFVGEAGASPIGGASCIFDSLTPLENPPGSPFNGLSGIGPYRESTGNMCGDTEKDDGEVFREIELNNILCQDEDNDGALDLPYALTWKNQAEVCTDPTDASQFIPDQQSKCINWVGEVPEIPVIPPDPLSIAVEKTAFPNVISSGKEVSFTVVVVNDGDDTFSLTVLDDDVYGDLTQLTQTNCILPQELSPGEEYTCAFTEIVSGVVPSVHVNEVTATVDNGMETKQASDTAEVEIIDDGRGSIGQIVWSDLNADGVQDADEPGIDGVTLDLLDISGVVVASTTSAQGGEYRFVDLDAGTYIVKVTDTANIVSTWVLTGGVDPLQVNLQADEHYYLANFGYAHAAIKLLKVVDPKVISAPGEQVTYNLEVSNVGPLDVDVTEITDVTLGSDATLVNCLVPFPLAVGESAICTFSRNLTGSPGDQVVNEAVAAARDVDGNVVFAQDDAIVFIVDPMDASIGDFVWLDGNGNGIQDPGEQGINDVDLELWVDTDNDLITDTQLAMTTTNSSGEYAFVDLSEGFYEVRIAADNPALEGLYLSGGVDPRSVVLGAGNAVSTADFGYSPIPKPRIEVFKTALTTVIAAPGGSVMYEVTVSNTGTIPVTLEVLNDHRIGAAKSAQACSLPQPLPVGYSYSCQYTANVTGDAGDDYYNAVSARAVDTSGQFAHGFDFAVVAIIDSNDGAIGDRVWADINANGLQEFWEPGLGNVSIGLFQAGTEISSTLTQGSGEYLFEGLSAGDYQIRVTDVNAVLSETILTGGVEPRNVSLATGQIVDNVDFGYSRALILVFKEGTPQTVEAPGGPVDYTVTVANAGFVDVTLTGLVDDQFDNLAGQGNCRVGIVIPARQSVICGFSAEVGGAADSQHINTVTATAEDSEGNVITGEDSFVVDIVAPAAGVIGILVWDDENGNGQREGSEPGIGSVTLDLRQDTNNDGSFDSVVSSTVTRSNGGYLFLPIPTGTFEVTVTDQYGVLDGRVLTGGVEPKDVPLGPGQIYLAANFGYFEEPFIPPIDPPEPPEPPQSESIPTVQGSAIWLLCLAIMLFALFELQRKRA